MDPGSSEAGHRAEQQQHVGRSRGETFTYEFSSGPSSVNNRFWPEILRRCHKDKLSAVLSRTAILPGSSPKHRAHISEPGLLKNVFFALFALRNRCFIFFIFRSLAGSGRHFIVYVASFLRRVVSDTGATKSSISATHWLSPLHLNFHMFTEELLMVVFSHFFHIV